MHKCKSSHTSSCTICGPETSCSKCDCFSWLYKQDLYLWLVTTTLCFVIQSHEELCWKGCPICLQVEHLFLCLLGCDKKLLCKLLTVATQVLLSQHTLRWNFWRWYCSFCRVTLNLLLPFFCVTNTCMRINITFSILKAKHLQLLWCSVFT